MKLKFKLSSLGVIATLFTMLLIFAACEKNEPNLPKGDIVGDINVTYTDSRGKQITIPYGSMSCAIRVVEFTPGNPWTDKKQYQNTNAILGAPDGDAAGNSLTLGTGGVVVLEFGVYITDGPGVDLYLFEIGPNVEATKVELSDDLKNWVYVGDADGATDGVDINGKVPNGAKYRYMRLTDLETHKGSSTPGADLDAVAVVHPKKIGSGNISDAVIYKDYRDNEIRVPGGALSFATFVVDNTLGDPPPSVHSVKDPEAVLGIPDYDDYNDTGYYSMGSGGEIVLGFNVFISDGPGNDIYVFEIGPDVEATKVEVSNDLKNWIYVGDADGSLSGVDIKGKVPKDGRYRYVRLTDLKTHSDVTWAGADLDAVAIMHPAVQ